MSTPSRIAILSLALLLIFGGSVAILMRAIPGPHSEMDYLVIGAIATFLALVVLFVVLITTWVKSPDVFYRRKRQ